MEVGGNAYDRVKEGENGRRGDAGSVREGDRELLAVEVADEVLDGGDDPVELFLQLVGVFFATTGDRGFSKLIERVEEEVRRQLGSGASDVSDGVLLLLDSPHIFVVVLVDQVAPRRRLGGVIETKETHGDLETRLQRRLVDGEGEVSNGSGEDRRLSEIADDLVSDAERFIKPILQIDAVVDELGLCDHGEKVLQVSERGEGDLEELDEELLDTCFEIAPLRSREQCARVARAENGLQKQEKLEFLPGLALHGADVDGTPLFFHRLEIRRTGSGVDEVAEEKEVKDVVLVGGEGGGRHGGEEIEDVDDGLGQRAVEAVGEVERGEEGNEGLLEENRLEGGVGRDEGDADVHSRGTSVRLRGPGPGEHFGEDVEHLQQHVAMLLGGVLVEALAVERDARVDPVEHL